MRIDRKLNLVVPIDPGDGVLCYVHVQPIAREVFEQNFQLLATAYVDTLGIGPAGTRVALLTLRRVAAEMQQEAVCEQLLNEMRRLANVLVPGTNGYEVVPWQEALGRGVFDEDDKREVDNLLCFFMLSWHMTSKRELERLLNLMRVLGVEQETSSTPTAFAASLTTSTEAAPSAQQETIQPSSVPH